MFGKPEWFRVRSVGWGLTPVRFQGWLYTGGWMTALLLPLLALLSRGQGWEAAIWLAVAMSALVWDVRGVRRAVLSPPEPQFARGETRRTYTLATGTGASPQADDDILIIE